MAQPSILCMSWIARPILRLSIQTALPRSSDIFKGQFWVEAPPSQSKGKKQTPRHFHFYERANLGAGLGAGLLSVTAHKSEAAAPVRSKTDNRLGVEDPY